MFVSYRELFVSTMLWIKIVTCFGSTKGQLISKCLFEKIVWTKIPTKNLTISALAHNLGARAEIVKFFRWYFGRNDDTQKTF